jgi:hypothetical protein
MRGCAFGFPAVLSAVVVLTAAALPATAWASGCGSGPGPVPTTPYSGFNSVLARAPYVTDLTQTSAVVTWATNQDIHGTLYYGPPGNCTANSVPVASGMVAQVRAPSRCPRLTIPMPMRGPSRWIGSVSTSRSPTAPFSRVVPS